MMSTGIKNLVTELYQEIVMGKGYTTPDPFCYAAALTAALPAARAARWFQVLLDDGSRRTVEIWLSVDPDGDVIFQLYDLTDRAEHREKLAGLARLGVAVQVEQTEDAVLAALTRGLKWILAGRGVDHPADLIASLYPPAISALH